MKKFVFFGFLILFIGAAFVFLPVKNENDINLEFLKGYGWITEENPVEKCEIQIPYVFDEVYEGYNFLQKEAGLDLTPFCGATAIRYTYILKNFPYPAVGEVRANVITVDKTPVAGDIMTVSANGFMYSLAFNESVCFLNQDGLFKNQQKDE